MKKILRSSNVFTLDVYVIIEMVPETMLASGMNISLCHPGLEAITFSESMALEYMEQYEVFNLQLIKITCNVPVEFIFELSSSLTRTKLFSMPDDEVINIFINSAFVDKFISTNEYIMKLTKYPLNYTFNEGDIIDGSNISINGNTQHILYTNNQREIIEEECYYRGDNSFDLLIKTISSKIFNIILLTRFIQDDELKTLLIYMKRIMLFRVVFIMRCNFYVPFCGDVCNKKLATFLEDKAGDYYGLHADTHIYDYINDAFCYYYTILSSNLENFEDYWVESE